MHSQTTAPPWKGRPWTRAILGGRENTLGPTFTASQPRDAPGVRVCDNEIMSKPDDLKVFIASKDPRCEGCKEDLGRKAWITLTKDKGALCLSCADLDHLVFLPSGDAALTRRSRKHSKLSAVVLKWSRARKRYERQGLLVEEPALTQAEQECAADDDVRAQRRALAAARRAELDQAYVKSFASAIRERFPGCTQKAADAIAQHACLKYSGRVGRSAAAKTLDETAVRLAVIAHVRHEMTDYDKLLMTGCERLEARRQVQGVVESVIDDWIGGRATVP